MQNQTPVTDQQITDARAAFVAAQQQHGPQHPITVAAGFAAMRLMQAKR
jgi:hypothetical protein